MSRGRRPKRVLALDPIAKGFGYAVLEGRELLLDWGVVYANPADLNRLTTRIERLIELYSPFLIAIEDQYQNRRRSGKALHFFAHVQLIAQGRGILLRRSSYQAAKSALGYKKGAKHEVAVLLVRAFPELGSWLPRPRKPWTSESATMALFDALALALLHL